MTTAPTTPPATPFLAYGQVLNGDGSPAVGALVVVRLGADQDRHSEPFSALVDDGAGYWALSLQVDACETASLALEVIRPDGATGSRWTCRPAQHSLRRLCCSRSDELPPDPSGFCALITTGDKQPKIQRVVTSF